MSSQAEGVKLSNAPDGLGYRLIELPFDLQSLLESDQAPVLTLESSDTSALLKTPNKTYALRQKNTSNDLILLLPGKDGLKAVSTVKETVELESLAAPLANMAPHTGSKGKWHEMFGKNR